MEPVPVVKRASFTAGSTLNVRFPAVTDASSPAGGVGCEASSEDAVERAMKVQEDVLRAAVKKTTMGHVYKSFGGRFA